MTLEEMNAELHKELPNLKALKVYVNSDYIKGETPELMLFVETRNLSEIDAVQAVIQKHMSVRVNAYKKLNMLTGSADIMEVWPSINNQ